MQPGARNVQRITAAGCANMFVMTQSLRSMSFLVVALSLATALIHADQVRRQGPATVTLDVALKAGGETVAAKGAGSCTHAPKASIYGVMAEMWMVRHSADDKSVQLTFWKPTDGSAPMFSVSVNAAKTTSISTVRGGKVTGSGSVTMTPAGKGGTFTIDAKTQAGQAITGTIKCDSFTAAVAEGGDLL